RAASLDHLNDPLPRGSSADSGGMSSLATGHAAHRGSRLRRSAFAPSSSPASTIVGSGYPQFSSLRALGLSSGRAHPCPEGTRLTCIRLCIQLSASSQRIWACSGLPDFGGGCVDKSLARI